jgi:diaminohydroxyphosphoribosylaminopyrimidine deaminase/5-amino-6-(5-phosphoribosylamino)uracil reductase
MIACGQSAPQESVDALTSAGCEVYRCAGETPSERLMSLLDELGRRKMTNILVEGGSRVLGSLRDLDQIDEVHAFIAPTLLGQADALPPVSGQGAKNLDLSTQLEDLKIRQVGEDAYLSGRVRHRA